MEYLVGAIAVTAIWLFFSIRKKKRQFISHHFADLAEPWLKARGVNRDSLMFNTYEQPGFARASGAVVIVGVGQRRNNGDFGFVVEVAPGRGVINGEELIPFGIATWDRQAAQVAAQSHRPMMDVLLDMAAQHRAQLQSSSASADPAPKRHQDPPLEGAPTRTNPDTKEPASWMLRFASAPDFMIRNPERIARVSGYLIVHVRDVRPIAARVVQAPSFPLRYPHALVFISEVSKEPEFFVTLEQSITDTPFLCIFRKDGSRANLGDGSSAVSDREFLRQALSLANKELQIRVKESDFN